MSVHTLVSLFALVVTIVANTSALTLSFPATNAMDTRIPTGMDDPMGLQRCKISPFSAPLA